MVVALWVGGGVVTWRCGLVGKSTCGTHVQTNASRRRVVVYLHNISANMCKCVKGIKTHLPRYTWGMPQIQCVISKIHRKFNLICTTLTFPQLLWLGKGSWLRPV